MHCQKNYPFKKQNSDLDVPLDENLSDDHYIEILKKSLSKLESIESNLIFFQAGVDTHRSDRYGKLNLSLAGLERRNKLVFDFAQKKKNPLLVFMGGGYSIPITNTVNAFSNLFTFFSTYKF